ncbi:hypothetical protein [Novosphingobium sp.]|uniref:hypothetical protein n=1 Tax=Novosphingobium sp. TaxID=1874826 RepID=UPI00262E6908|nr:hypothetical protein [Novosphingobium sp.]
MPALIARATYSSAIGNHDYRGNPQAQLDYARTSPRWRMPQRHYQVSGAESGVPQLDLFVIDTSPTVHKYRDEVDSVIARNVAARSGFAAMTVGKAGLSLEFKDLTGSRLYQTLLAT